MSFDEFLPLLKGVAKNKDKHVQGDFIEAFKVFDKEQNGHISTAELRHLLTNLGMSNLVWVWESYDGRVKFQLRVALISEA